MGKLIWQEDISGFKLLICPGEIVGETFKTLPNQTSITAASMHILNEGANGTGVMGIADGLLADPADWITNEYRPLSEMNGWADFGSVNCAVEPETVYALFYKLITGTVVGISGSTSNPYIGLAKYYDGIDWYSFPEDDDLAFRIYGEVGQQECAVYTNQTACELAGCYWWNGSCHDWAPSCPNLINEADCIRYGCYWWPAPWNVCRDEPLNGEIYLDECLTCGWVDGCDHGPEKTQFTTDEEIHCSRILRSDTPRSWYGETYGYKWYHNGSLFKENTNTISDSGTYTRWCAHTWCSVANCPGPGTGYIEAYWEGQKMGQTKTYTVIGGVGAIGSILPSSEFYTGPYQQGDMAHIMKLDVKNIGDAEGSIWCKFYSYPGTYKEQNHASHTPYLQPGEADQWNLYYTIPTAWQGSIPLGVKVWAHDCEPEPGWGMLGTHMFNMRKH